MVTLEVLVIFYLPSETEIEPDLTLLEIRKKMTNLSSFRESKGLIAFPWRDCSLLLLKQTLALATCLFSAHGSLLGDVT